LQAFERIEARLQGGLGVSVSFYGGSPVRVEDLFSRSTWLHEALVPADVSHIERAIDGWVQLFARLLHFGYVPYAQWNYTWGSCVDPGNACVDGGLTDLLTLVSFETLGDIRLFRLSVLASIDILARTTSLLYGTQAHITPDRITPNVVSLTAAHLRPRLLRAIEAERPGTQQMHPWIEDLLTSGDMVRLISSMRSRLHRVPYTGPNWDFEIASSSSSFP
jgi:hypothetical protein